MGLGGEDSELEDVDQDSMSDSVVIDIRLVSWRSVAGSDWCWRGGGIFGLFWEIRTIRVNSCAQNITTLKPTREEHRLRDRA